MKKTVLTTLALAASAAIVMIGAAPASAAGNSIDPGDSLYAINCDTEYFNWTLLSVDPATALSTKIGDGAGYDPEYFACAFQPAYNPATGKSYYIQFQNGEFNHSLLAEIDVATGVSTTIGEFNEPVPEGEDLYPIIDAMAIGLDGSAFALGEGDLYSVDLATGELTYIGESLVSTWAFAVDPTSGIFYAIDNENELFIVDTTDGSFTSGGQVGVESGSIFSLQIDGGGTFWIQADEQSESGASLWSFRLDTLSSPVYSGPFVDGPFYTEAILIIPGEPVLPATGADLSVAPLAAGLAGVLTLLGAVVVVTRRRRTA